MKLSAPHDTVARHAVAIASSLVQCHADERNDASRRSGPRADPGMKDLLANLSPPFPAALQLPTLAVGSAHVVLHKRDARAGVPMIQVLRRRAPEPPLPS